MKKTSKLLDFRRWLHWRLPFWQYSAQPAAEAASEQTRFRSVITSELLRSSLILITESFTPSLSSCCDSTDWFILFWLDFILFPCILSWTLPLSILILLWVLHCLYHNFQSTFTCVFYVTLSRTILYMYICIFIYLSIYWKSGTSELFGANVICFSMYRL